MDQNRNWVLSVEMPCFMADEAGKMENALTCFSFLDSKKESHEISIFFFNGNAMVN